MSLSAAALSVPHRLHAVSLRLAAGAVTAIVGPNGAGKSTLLAALAGLVPHAAPRVFLDSTALAALPPLRRARALGYLPQADEVAWNLSVETLVGLGRLPWQSGEERPGREADAAAIAAALDALALRPLATRAVATLSGGERARALLARVIAGTPRWILADEPLAALDLAHQQALLAHFHAAARAGTGVVVVLHDLAQAMNHADHVIVLDRGHPVAEGPPALALTQDLVRRVWQLPQARWLGDPGARALAL